MKYYKQVAKNYYHVVGNESEATHYIGDDDKIRVMSTGKLVTQTSRQPTEEPLVLPTMNFGREQKEVKANRSPVEEPLVLPAMQF